jgi:hypothetical protein
MIHTMILSDTIIYIGKKKEVWVSNIIIIKIKKTIFYGTKKKLLVLLTKIYLNIYIN